MVDHQRLELSVFTEDAMRRVGRWIDLVIYGRYRAPGRFGPLRRLPLQASLWSRDYQIGRVPRKADR
jgi:hypothetical protein